MRKVLCLIGLALFFGLFPQSASAQSDRFSTFGWFLRCYDASLDEDPDADLEAVWGMYSTEFPNLPGQAILENDLMIVSLGQSGSVTYGGGPGHCFAEAKGSDYAGRMAFMVGGVGSRQTDMDDFMALTMGAPYDPAGDFCFSMITVGGDEVENAAVYTGVGTFFTGASKRYQISAGAVNGVFVERETRLIGDAVRFRYRVFNQGAGVITAGMYFCGLPAMMLNGLQSDNRGVRAGNWDVTGFWDIGIGKPVRNERRYQRPSPRFPDKVEILFGQEFAYGFVLDNTPPEATDDAAIADLILIGAYFASPSLIQNNEVRTQVFTDQPGGTSEEADILIGAGAFVQRFPAAAIPGGGFRDIIHYVRPNWSVGDYLDPYSFLLDAPRLIASDPTDPTQLSPSTFPLVAYVDNQYADLDKEVALVNVQFRIDLGEGLTLAPGEQQLKVISTINPNAIDSVEWNVVPDVTVTGRVPFSVTVTPTPGPSKTLTGEIMVANTPRLRLGEGPNLVAIPYGFPDSSFESILSAAAPGDEDLKLGVDFNAYRWVPSQFGYVPATTAERGAGYWIFPKSDLGFRLLADATLPADINTGGLLFSLEEGWNLIGNPYNYVVPASQIVGVAEDLPESALTWSQLIQSGIINGTMVAYNREEGQYEFITGLEAEIEPHKGYWIFVNTSLPLRISWPDVTLQGLPGAFRSAGQKTLGDRWPQNPKEWRVQLSARTASGMDSQNYIAVVTDSRKANWFRTHEPPKIPQSKVNLSIEDSIKGKPTRMAQAVMDRLAKREFKVYVESEEAGEVTVTWPNMPSVPRNVRMRVTDPSTGATRDMRSASGYTFTMAEPGTRELIVTLEPGGSLRPVIGNVLVNRSGRESNSPVTLTYALSADALVSVRVLSGAGKEVFTITRGRADRAGENSVTWLLRDNANRAVAPGVYQMEILAETPSGDRARRIVPVNVIR